MSRRIRHRSPIVLVGAIILVLLSSGLSLAQDGDGDGVPDAVDLCPTEDSSFFDADGDGCIDPTANGRHIEYWDPSDLPLHYSIHVAGAPFLTDGSDVLALQTAMSTWPALAGVELSAAYDGTTSQSDAGFDDVNLITFQDPDFATVYGSAVIAVGVTWSYTSPTLHNGRSVRPGQIVDADMIFNPNRTFSTDTGGVGVDLLSVGIHEAGHLFGLSHSVIETATMFPALPPATDGRTLEADDRSAMFLAYPNAAVLSQSTSLSGVVTDGGDGSPVPGAAVFAISAATGDSAACQYTLPDGSYLFAGLDPGDYRVAIHPLDGGSGIKGITPGFINALVDSTANTLFASEYWNAGESAFDDPTLSDVVTLISGSPTAGIDFITNVDATPPSVVDWQPNDASVDVDADAVVLLRYDEPIDFATASTRIHLDRMEAGGPVGIAGSLVLLPDGVTLVLQPTVPLTAAASHRVTIDAGVTDLFGNATTSAFVTSFTTAPAAGLALGGLTPRQGIPGSVVTLTGTGFDPTPGATTVDFGGSAANVISQTSTSVVVEVPALSAGDVAVSVGSGGASTPTTLFTVLATTAPVRANLLSQVGLTGTPRQVCVLADGSFAYLATDAGISVVSLDPTQTDYLTEIAQIPVVGGVEAVAATSDGSRVYGVARSSRSLLAVNSAYGSLLNRDPLFNQVLDTIALSEEPLGIGVDPRGTRAYIPTLQGDILVFDVARNFGADSATFHEQIGLISTGSPDLVGVVGFDPLGGRVLVPRAGGHLLVYRDSVPRDFLADVSVGLDPQAICVDPRGTQAFVSDASGVVHVVDLTALAATDVLDIGGLTRGVVVQPNGGMLLAADRIGDRITQVDLRPATAGFHTVVGEIPTGLNPVDLQFSPDGSYLYVLEQGTGTLAVFSVGDGPLLRAVNPPYAGPGDTVMLLGEGFPTLDFGQAPGSVRPEAEFDGVAAQVLSSSSTAMVAVVPPGFAGGLVRARAVGGPSVPGQAPDPFSNPVALELTPMPTPGQAFENAISLGPELGYDWGTGMDNTLAVAPNGRFVILVRSEKELVLLGADPSLPDYRQVLTTLDLGGNHAAHTVVISPDSRRAFVSLDNRVEIVDTDPLSPDYGTSLGTVDFSPVNPLFHSIEPHVLVGMPDGETLVVNNEDGGVIMVDLREGPGQYRAFDIVHETGTPGELSDVIAHPQGRFLYATSTEDDKATLHIIATDPTQPNYLQELTQFPLPYAGRGLTISPDGTRLFVATVNISKVAFRVLELDVSSPAAPVMVQSAIVEQAPAHHKGRIHMLPHGERLIVDTMSELVELDISGGGLQILNRLPMPGGSKYVGIAPTPDARQVYTAVIGAAAPQVLLPAAGATLDVLSGGDQVGVASQPLPQKIRVFVLEADSTAAVDQELFVTVTKGGGTLDNGTGYQVYRTDGDGVAEIQWTLGAALTPSPPPATPTHQIQVLLQNPVSGDVSVNVAATAVADPTTLPLAIATLYPPDGSTDMGVNTAVQIGFSRGVDRNSVSSANYSLHVVGSPDPVPAVFGFANDDRSVSLIPLSSLSSSTSYVLQVGADILDSSGGALTTPATTSFTTAAPPPPTVGSVSPSSGTPGTPVTVAGSGFADSASQVTVFFGGASVVPQSVSPEALLVTIPPGAVSGTLRVESMGTASNAVAFTVLAPVTEPLNTVVATIPTGVPTQTAAVVPDGERAYTVSSSTNQVIPLDLTTLQTGTPIPVGNDPVAIVVTPDGREAYVANFLSSTISVIDLATDAVVETIPVGSSPFELAMSPGGNSLYVVNLGDQTLSVVDTNPTSATFHRELTRVPLGTTTQGMAISPDGGTLYLGTNDGFLILDLSPSSIGVVASVPTGASTKGAQITPDGSLLILVTGAGDVLLVDLTPGANHQVVASVPTGASTKGAQITPDGSLLYVFQENSDDILVFALNLTVPVGVLDPRGASQTLSVNLTLVDTLVEVVDPVYIVFDPAGSGIGLVGEGSTEQVTIINYLQVPTGDLDAQMSFDPRTPTLPSLGRYPEAHVQLPAGFFAEDVAITSVTLTNGTQQAPTVLGREAFEDVDQNGVSELLLRFQRPDFEMLYPPGDSVVVQVHGSLVQAARDFVAQTTVISQRPTLLAPIGGEMFEQSGFAEDVFEQTTIRWRNDTAGAADSVVVRYSLDDGDNWTLIEGRPAVAGEDSLIWIIPEPTTEKGRVSVTFYDDQGQDIGMAMNFAPFFINMNPVAVSFDHLDARIDQASALLQWSLGLPSPVTFHVWRTDREDGNYERITVSPVAALDGTPGQHFAFRDPEIEGNHNYWYLLEEVTPWGGGTRHGPYRVSYVVGNHLGANHPNSFNPRTTIEFSVAEAGRARLAVYDLKGRRVRVLVEGILQPDNYSVTWDGTDGRGREVSSGVYLYRLEAENFVATRKMVLVR